MKNKIIYKVNFLHYMLSMTKRSRHKEADVRTSRVM